MNNNILTILVIIGAAIIINLSSPLISLSHLSPICSALRISSPVPAPFPFITFSRLSLFHPAALVSPYAIHQFPAQDKSGTVSSPLALSYSRFPSPSLLSRFLIPIFLLLLFFSFLLSSFTRIGFLLSFDFSSWSIFFHFFVSLFVFCVLSSLFSFFLRFFSTYHPRFSLLSSI